MWSIAEYRYVFIAVGLIGVILLSVPSALLVVHLPGGEQFSELYVLGPGHMAEGYPFNVSAGNGYLVYLGVTNHMGSSTYYGVDVKFCNESEPLPTDSVPSLLPALYEYSFFLEDGQAWEGSLTFSFSNITFSLSNAGNSCYVGRLNLNGFEFEIDKKVAWDNVSSGFYYQLIFELWRYDQTSDVLLYDGRFVNLWLNITSNG